MTRLASNKAIIILRIIDQCQKTGQWLYDSQKCSNKDFVSVKKALPNVDECRKPFIGSYSSAQEGNCCFLLVRVDQHKDFGSGGRSSGSFLGSWRNDRKELYNDVPIRSLSELPKYGEQLVVFSYSPYSLNANYNFATLTLSESDFKEHRIIKLFVLFNGRTAIEFIKCNTASGLADRSNLCWKNGKPVKLKDDVNSLRFIVLGKE